MKLKRPLRRLGFHALKNLATVAAIGGPDRVRAWGERLGRADFQLRPRLKHRLIEALTELDRRRDDLQLNQPIPLILKTAYQTNDRALLEVLALYASRAPIDALLPPIHVRNIDQLDQARAAKRGVILVGMHMGNGVALAAHLNQHVAPTHVVYRESNKIPRGFFHQGLTRLMASAIGTDGVDGGLRASLKVLKRDEMLFILADQGRKGATPDHRFLEKPFLLPTGPAQLAVKTGAPMVAMFLTNVGRGWQFDALPPIWPEGSGKIEHLNQRLIELMEGHILQHPQWWSWHQRRWSKEAFDHPEIGAH